MLGVSLPFNWLITGVGDIGERFSFLEKLRYLGVDSIELRTVEPFYDPSDVLKAANFLWDFGFTLTVHSRVLSENSAVNDVFSPLSGVLKHLRQKKLTVVIHPIVGDNVKVLQSLSDHIYFLGKDVYIALENNRLLPDKTEGDSAALVLDAVNNADRKNIGICFDMGHYRYYRLKNFPDSPFELPTKEFLRKVIHTHIHSLDGLKTHYPVTGDEQYLIDSMNAVSFEYFGVYNIELDIGRIRSKYNVGDAIVSSVKNLLDMLPHVERVYKRVRDNFDIWFDSSTSVLSEPHGMHFGLMHSSSYFFSDNGYRFAVDIAFRNARFLSDAPARMHDKLKNLDLFIVTHGHRDHFEESTARALSDTDIKWLIPDFLLDMAADFGIKKENTIVIGENETVKAGPLSVTAFAGRHYRAGTDKGVPEYGYYIKSDNGVSLVLPADVRDLSLDSMPDIPKADYCFANVWLKDYQCMNEIDDGVVTAFAKFMLSFSDKNIFITHINEDGRRNTEMWRNYHAGLISARIGEISPETSVLTPQNGEIFSLYQEH